MKSLDNIAEDLFNKIRGRFPSVTIGDGDGKVINDPLAARFFDFDFKEGDKNLGKVSISIDENALAVMYHNNFVEDQDTTTKSRWFDFLRELRTFAKKRLLSFDTRDITKSNLNKRDYKFLAQQQGGDAMMSESKLYGTSRVSYQDIGTARLNIRHTESVNTELATGRTQKIGAIYVESSEGERFKYPYKHLTGARAMARHVAEGGKPFDDFGKHIVSMSEEMSKLRKFKNYMGRSAVMAESLSEYMDVVKERITTVKKTLESLQRETYYKQTIESFEAPVIEDVPEDVAENWIDQLTIRQFNEELKDVFPYIYKLVSEATKAQELSPEDLVAEAKCSDCGKDPCCCDEEVDEAHGNSKEYDKCWDGYERVPGTTRGEKGSCRKISEDPIEDAIDSLMGQFREGKGQATCGCTPDSCSHCAGDHSLSEVGQKCSCCGNEIKEIAAEGNAFSKALAKAKANNDDEMEIDGEKIPVTEFILSMFDRETGQFPKGETGVLTAVEKDYGERYINPAKEFISRIQETYKTFKDPELMDDETFEGGPITHAIANTELGDKIAKAIDDRPTKGFSAQNLVKAAIEKFGPTFYNMIGLTDEEKAELAPMLRDQGIEYNPNETEDLKRVKSLAGL